MSLECNTSSYNLVTSTMVASRDEFRKLDGEGPNGYFYFLGRTKCL
jgi:hypothetical protein